MKYANLLAELKEEHHRLSELAAMLDGVVTAAALQLADDEQGDPQILELRREAVHLKEQITDIVCQ